MQDLLQSREDETNLACAHPEHPALDRLAVDLEGLNAEIRALCKADLPAALIHRISGGAREQASIAFMMLEDCTARADDGTLTEKHIANVEKWLTGVRGWIEKRKTAYAVNCRRKLCVVRSRR